MTMKRIKELEDENKRLRDGAASIARGNFLRLEVSLIKNSWSNNKMSEEKIYYAIICLAVQLALFIAPLILLLDSRRRK